MGNKPNPTTVTEKINYMEDFIDLDKYITEGDCDPESIVAYFKENHKNYRRLYGGQGNMHFIVSKDGKTYNIEDRFYQPEAAASFAKPGDKVLELGTGFGQNLVHLAQLHPDVEFYGVDLCPVENEEVQSCSNIVKILEKNYSSLPEFEDNTFDVIYAIETIVHNSSEDKDKIMSEVFRVLKPGGHFLVHDYATSELFESYGREEQIAMKVMAKGSSAALIESKEEWMGHFTQAGFKTVAVNDLTERVQPDLLRLQRHIDKVMLHPLRAKIVFKSLPWRYTVNMISAWLGYELTREHIGNYCEWIMQK